MFSFFFFFFADCTESQLFVLPNRTDLHPHSPARGPNLLVWQVSCTLPCTFDLTYEGVPDAPKEMAAAPGPVAGPDLTALLRERRAAFDARFEATFGLSGLGYNGTEVAFARGALSNLVGGIGYFHGHSLYEDPLRETLRNTG